MGKKPPRIRIPGYRVRKVRGRGAMATVYRAVHERLEKTVALKVLHPFVAEDPDYRERFLREAKSAARLNHPNVVRAYEAGEHEGSFFFAMEYVDGEDLGERLEREGSIDEEEALRIGIQVAKGLAAAEEHSLVHRDVKPENVLLGQEGAVKLADLGLAKVQGDGSLTAEGYTLGTVAFFSPEQCRGARDLDIRSDLYALGGLLYTAISGELPFGLGENPVLTMKAILREEPTPLEELSVAAPTTIEAVRILMQKDRRLRPPSAEAAVELLEETLLRLKQPAAAAPARRSRRRAGPRKASAVSTAASSSASTTPLLMGVVGVAMAVGVLLAISGGEPPPDPSPRPEPLAQASPTPAPRRVSDRQPPPAPRATPRATPSARPAPRATPEPTPELSLPAALPTRRPRGVDGAVGAPPAAPERVPPESVPPERVPPERPPATPAPPLATPAPPASERLLAGLRAGEKRLDAASGLARLGYSWEGAGELEDWSFIAEQVEIERGGLRFAVPARGEGTFVLRQPLHPPIEIRYSVRVTTRGVGRHGVLWTTFGDELASFGGATLYARGGGEPRYLAGRKKPHTAFAGRRKTVRLRLEEGRSQGWLDGKLLYDHPRGAQGPVSIGFRLERGVGIDLRDLVVEGRLEGAR